MLELLAHQRSETVGPAAEVDRLAGHQHLNAGGELIVGMNLNRTPDRTRRTEYLLLSKRTKQVFETDAGTAWNPSNLPA